MAESVVVDLRNVFEAFVAAAESLPEERFASGRTAHRVMEEGAFAHIREHRIEIEQDGASRRAAAQVPHGKGELR